MAAHELMLDYAAGALAPGPALLARTHAAMRPDARATLRACEDAGGVLLGRLVPAALSSTALKSVFERLDTPERPARQDTTPGPVDEPYEALPPVVRAILDGADVEALSGWRTVAPGIARLALSAFSDREHDVALVRLAPGEAMMDHGHTGEELTLVLRGAYQDCGARFEAGDVAYADAGVEHRPEVVGEEPCVCLTVVTGGVRLRHPLRALLRLILR